MLIAASQFTAALEMCMDHEVVITEVGNCPMSCMCEQRLHGAARMIKGCIRLHIGKSDLCLVRTACNAFRPSLEGYGTQQHGRDMLH